MGTFPVYKSKEVVVPSALEKRCAGDVGPPQTQPNVRLIFLTSSDSPNPAQIFNSVLEHHRLDTDKGEAFELDMYVPDLKLALEYQGEQHFHDVFQANKVGRQKDTDSQKQAACISRGIHLLEVPYWWSGSVSDLVSRIQQAFPNLLPSEEPEVGTATSSRDHTELF